MIQRIQTIWLLLACAAAAATIYFPFYSGIPVTDSLHQIRLVTAMDQVYIITITVASALTSLVAIFLFNNRKLQMRVTIANFLLSLILIALYFVDIKENFGELNLPLVTCVFAFVIPIFLFLAFRGIYKDNRLVRSVDRLR